MSSTAVSKNKYSSLNLNKTVKTFKPHAARAAASGPRLLTLGRGKGGRAKVVNAPKPFNLPSRKKESKGFDPNVQLIRGKTGVAGWGSKPQVDPRSDVQGPALPNPVREQNEKNAARAQNGTGWQRNANPTRGVGRGRHGPPDTGASYELRPQGRSFRSHTRPDDRTNGDWRRDAFHDDEPGLVGARNPEDSHDGPRDAPRTRPPAAPKRILTRDGPVLPTPKPQSRPKEKPQPTLERKENVSLPSGDHDSPQPDDYEEREETPTDQDRSPASVSHDVDVDVDAGQVFSGRLVRRGPVPTVSLKEPKPQALEKSSETVVKPSPKQWGDMSIAQQLAGTSSNTNTKPEPVRPADPRLRFQHSTSRTQGDLQGLPQPRGVAPTGRYRTLYDPNQPRPAHGQSNSQQVRDSSRPVDHAVFTGDAESYDRSPATGAPHIGPPGGPATLELARSHDPHFSVADDLDGARHRSPPLPPDTEPRTAWGEPRQPRTLASSREEQTNGGSSLWGPPSPMETASRPFASALSSVSLPPPVQLPTSEDHIVPVGGAMPLLRSEREALERQRQQAEHTGQRSTSSSPWPVDMASSEILESHQADAVSRQDREPRRVVGLSGLSPGLAGVPAPPLGVMPMPVGHKPSLNSQKSFSDPHTDQRPAGQTVAWGVDTVQHPQSAAATQWTAGTLSGQAKPSYLMDYSIFESHPRPRHLQQQVHTQQHSSRPPQEAGQQRLMPSRSSQLQLQSLQQHVGPQQSQQQLLQHQRQLRHAMEQQQLRQQQLEPQQLQPQPQQLQLQHPQHLPQSHISQLQPQNIPMMQGVFLPYLTTQYGLPAGSGVTVADLGLGFGPWQGVPVSAQQPNTQAAPQSAQSLGGHQDAQSQQAAGSRQGNQAPTLSYLGAARQGDMDSSQFAPGVPQQLLQQSQLQQAQPPLAEQEESRPQQLQEEQEQEQPQQGGQGRRRTRGGRGKRRKGQQGQQGSQQAQQQGQQGSQQGDQSEQSHQSTQRGQQQPRPRARLTQTAARERKPRQSGEANPTQPAKRNRRRRERAPQSQGQGQAQAHDQGQPDKDKAQPEPESGRRNRGRGKRGNRGGGGAGGSTSNGSEPKSQNQGARRRNGKGKQRGQVPGERSGVVQQNSQPGSGRRRGGKAKGAVSQS